MRTNHSLNLPYTTLQKLTTGKATTRRTSCHSRTDDKQTTAQAAASSFASSTTARVAYHFPTSPAIEEANVPMPKTRAVGLKAVTVLSLHTGKIPSWQEYTI